MILSKSSPFRSFVKRSLSAVGKSLVSFSERISYTPMEVIDRDGTWVVCRHDEIEWKLDISLGVDSALYRTGVFEPDSTRWMREVVKPGMVVADVGANFGYYTIQCSKLVGNSGKVYAFEPSKKFRGRLLDHIERNHCANVKVIGKGLSNKQRKMKLFVGGDSASFYPWDAEMSGAVSETVEVQAFDSVVRKEKISRLDVVKVDVDGHEPYFLQGAARSLKNMRPVILIECNQLALQKTGSSVDELALHLRRLEYELRSERTGKAFESDDELFREAKNCAYSVNLVCVPVR